jgi:hypothetical protein
MFSRVERGFLLNVVGAPFPLAGRAGGWVGLRPGFIIVSRTHTGNLNDSPLVSTAQAMRAFFAAMATTAFQ